MGRWIFFRIDRMEDRKEGRKEGREEGRKEGRKEGRNDMHASEINMAYII